MQRRFVRASSILLIPQLPTWWMTQVSQLPNRRFGILIVFRNSHQWPDICGRSRGRLVLVVMLYRISQLRRGDGNAYVIPVVATTGFVINPSIGFRDEARALHNRIIKYWQQRTVSEIVREYWHSFRPPSEALLSGKFHSHLPVKWNDYYILQQRHQLPLDPHPVSYTPSCRYRVQPNNWGYITTHLVVEALLNKRFTALLLIYWMMEAVRHGGQAVRKLCQI